MSSSYHDCHLSHVTFYLHPASQSPMTVISNVNLISTTEPVCTYNSPLSKSLLPAVYDKWLTTETSSIQDQSLAKPLRPSTVIPSIRADTPSTVNPSLLDTLPTTVIPSISIEKPTAGIPSIVGPSLPYNQQPSFPAYQLKNLLHEYPVLLIHLFSTHYQQPSFPAYQLKNLLLE